MGIKVECIQLVPRAFFCIISCDVQLITVFCQAYGLRMEGTLGPLMYSFMV